MGERTPPRACLFLTLSALFFLGSTGCENHLCDPSAASWGAEANQGDLLTDTMWESSPADGTWAPYPHQVTLTFDFSSFFPTCDGGNAPLLYISPDETPSAVDGGNYTIVGGNLAEIEFGPPGQLAVYNNSCADYYIRAVVCCPAAQGGGDGGVKTGCTP